MGSRGLPGAGCCRVSCRQLICTSPPNHANGPAQRKSITSTLFHFSARFYFWTRRPARRACSCAPGFCGICMASSVRLLVFRAMQTRVGPVCPQRCLAALGSGLRAASTASQPTLRAALAAPAAPAGGQLPQQRPPQAAQQRQRLRTQAAAASAADSDAGAAAAVATQERKAGSGKIGDAAGRGMVDLNPPRGTRDFFPEDKRLQNWLFDEFAAVSRLYGFEQIDFPVLESGGWRCAVGTEQESLVLRPGGAQATGRACVLARLLLPQLPSRLSSPSSTCSSPPCSCPPALPTTHTRRRGAVRAQGGGGDHGAAVQL